MQRATRRGWRGALVALLIIVWLYGSLLVSLGGWLALALFSLLVVLLISVVLLATRDKTSPAHESA